MHYDKEMLMKKLAGVIFVVSLMMSSCGKLATLAGKTAVNQIISNSANEKVLNLPIKEVLAITAPEYNENMSIKEALKLGLNVYSAKTLKQLEDYADLRAKSPEIIDNSPNIDFTNPILNVHKPTLTG
jgi:uncharacterized NAD-dependent epimerase/dehydratase family protein